MVTRIARSFGLLGAVASFVACSGAPPSDVSQSSSEALGASSTNASNLALVRQIEDHRLLGSPQLAALLSNSDPVVRAAAATAVGRIGDPSLEANVVSLLGDASVDVRRASALALGLLGGSTAEAALDARFTVETDTQTKQAILQALAQAGTATSVPVATGALAASLPAEVQAAAAEAYGTMVHGGAAPSSDPAVVTELIAFAGATPEPRSVAAAYALASLPGGRGAFDEAALTAAFHSAAAPSARAYLTTPLASLGSSTSVATLIAASSGDVDARVRGAACSALATTGSGASVLTALSAALRDPSPAVAVASATAIGAVGSAAASLVPQLDALFDGSSSAWVQSTVLATLVAVDAASSRSRVLAGLSDPWPVQLAAIGALPSIATAADLPTLLTLAGGGDKRLAYAAIEAISELPASLITPAVKPAMVAVLARGDWELTSGVADVSVAFGWTDFAAKLNAAYPSFAGDAAMNGRLEIVWALGTIGSTTDLPLLQSAIDDDTVLVSQYAAASYQQLTGTNVSSEVRKENVVTTETPSPSDVSEALSSLVVLQTTRGTIAIQMLAETPLNAVNFVRLARSGFYDGLGFHRVIPNFVEQGGDPRGDGTGGSNHMVRDELSRVPHVRGTVGLATEGKDTGSSQFFFNEGWNVELDERYTVFGAVVYGIDAAERLEVGDTIESVLVIPGFAGPLDEPPASTEM